MLGEFELIDILLVSEIAWCVLLIGNRTLERALFYVGALVASGYVATISAKWVTNILFGHASFTTAWLTGQIQVPAEPVGLIESVLPPQSTIGGHVVDAHWIAIHITSAFLASLITISVFMVFIVVSQLTLALWDLPTMQARGAKKFTSYGLSLICGLYVAFLTGDTFANLSWLRLFSPISGEVSHSVLLGFVATGLSFVRVYIS